MGLDLRTMMVMIAALSLLLSALFVLASLHAWKLAGVRLWACSNLMLSVGLVLPQIAGGPPGGPLVGGAALVAAGFLLQHAGIRRFRGLRVDVRVPALVCLLVALQTLWFTLVAPNIALRAVLNSLVFTLICAASARLLLIPLKAPLRTAYWLTGASFAGLALVFLARAIVLANIDGHAYTLYVNLPINQATFFAGSVTLLCINFGFVLMMNYRLADELQHLATHDSLTGALTRRSLLAEAERLLSRCRRTQASLAVLMIDVDHFKQINDRFGHVAGDEVLCRLAEVVRASIRSSDYFARYGGEEFCLLLPDLEVAQAVALAERLRCTYAATPVDLGGTQVRSTISIGVADTRTRGTDFADLIAAADAAMYAAKQCGRDQVQVFAAV